MSNAPKRPNRFLLYAISLFCIALMAILCIPPIINLNSLKPTIEAAILNRTGIEATIHGNIHFSLIGTTTIVAQNISVPNGVISSCEFTMPWRDLFDLKNAHMSDTILVKGASLEIQKIVPWDVNAHIVVKDSKFKFLNKEYNIIDADLTKNNVYAQIRTDQHKYEIKSFNDNFTIKNKNNDLNLTGVLLPDGTATGHISIIAENINRWFEFDKPKIDGTFPITADMTWDGEYGVKFYNISANGVTGRIYFQNDGRKDVALQTKTADYDMSFILNDTDLLKDANFDMDFYGKIKFLNKTFSHLYVNISGQNNKVNITEIVADDLKITGGYIDENGAHNLQIKLTENGKLTTCLFNGNPNVWSCDKFSYDNKIFGNVSIDGEELIANVYSKEPIKDINIIIDSAKRLGTHGIIKFNLSDMSGMITINGKKHKIKYDYVYNKTLDWANIDLPFLPQFMFNEPGNIIWKDGAITFVPNSKSWNLISENDSFYIIGDNFKTWFPGKDLQSLQNLPYKLRGNYKNGNISDLTLEIANHKFVGSATKKAITLKTDLLNLDSFISKDFVNNYDELSFFTIAPITIPYDLNINISLSSDWIVYDNQKYNNFVYSLRNNSQTFSITDSDRGNLLATIKKNNLNYSINIQLNKFVFESQILPQNMPLNISDTTLTAEIKLNTHGKIAHDIWANLNGDFDLSFDGGTLYGLGLPEFYASANQINILNAEYFLSHALDGGTTPIKKLRIIGTYESGDVKTTTPFTLSMPHTDTTGNLQITDKRMLANIQMVLRGTSPSPAPIEMTIYPDGFHEYSLSEIMTSFDPEYMRTFIKTHDRF